MKKLIVQKMIDRVDVINNLTMFHFPMFNYGFDNIVDSFGESQIKAIENFRQIISMLIYDRENNILKVRVWDLCDINTTIEVELKDIRIKKEELGSYPWDEFELWRAEQAVLIFFSVINEYKAVIYNSYFQDICHPDGNPIDCLHTLKDFINQNISYYW